MRWKCKHKIYPVVGELKQKLKFAWLPVCCDSNTWIWLEDYVTTYEYYEYPCLYCDVPSNDFRWRAISKIAVGNED